MKILKIAVIAPQPFVEIRGTSMANLRLAQILADAGHEVDVITYPFGSAPPHPSVTVHRCRSVPLVRSVGIGFSPAKLLLDISLAVRAFHVLRSSKFDRIHAVEEGVFIGAALGRRTGTPVIYDMDSILSDEIGRTALRVLPPVMWMIRALERWAIRNSAVVLTICEGMADYVRTIDPAKDVAVVPDVPVSPSPGGPDADRARTWMPPEILDGRRIVMYAGSLAGYQGLELLISAMTRVTEAVLVVVGGDDKGIERLSKLADAAGVMHNLVFVGKRPPEQVPDFLAAADILVSPRRGGINPPGKMYTYMQSGTPMVATNIPAHTAVLDSDTAVLVEPSPDGIADGILWALAHPGEAKSRAERAQNLVREMTPESQARAILGAYDRIRFRGRGRSPSRPVSEPR